MEVIFSLFVSVVGVFLGFSASIYWEKKKEGKKAKGNANKLDGLLAISLSELKRRTKLIDQEIADQACPTINFDWRVFDFYRKDYPMSLARSEIYEKLGLLISMLQSANQHVATMGSMFGSRGHNENFITMRVAIGRKKVEIHNKAVEIEKLLDQLK